MVRHWMVMNNPLPSSGLQLRSRITRDGRLELSLIDDAVIAPGLDEVVVRIEASPINPSDVALLLGPADLSTMSAAGTTERPVLTATVPESALSGLAARLDR